MANSFTGRGFFKPLPHRRRSDVSTNLYDYHVPVNADVGMIDVAVVAEHAPDINALGAKGMGEISDLPLTPDKPA